MAHYEIDVEYDDPKEIPFRKICIYCGDPATESFYIEEESKLRGILNKPWLSIFILFVVCLVILSALMPDRSITAPAILLAGLIWSFSSSYLKKTYKDIFRHANVFTCSNCYASWKKRETISSSYWGIIFVLFLLLTISSFIYNLEEFKSNDLVTYILGLCIFGIFLGPIIIKTITNFYQIKLDIPFSLSRQGLLKGPTKLTILEDDFKRLIDDTLDKDR